MEGEEEKRSASRRQANKPWRPVPRGLLTLTQMRRALLFTIPAQDAPTPYWEAILTGSVKSVTHSFDFRGRGRRRLVTFGAWDIELGDWCQMVNQRKPDKRRDFSLSPSSHDYNL
ncbi:hypothetical protein PG984_015769 [Apiospora sp. TS-2023a]